MRTRIDLELELLERVGDLVGDDLVLLDDRLVGDRVADRVAGRAADDHVLQLDLDRLALVDRRLGDAVERAAVDLVDDDVLRHVGELAGEVARVGGLQGGVGQALAGAVGRAEVLEHRQAFAEVGLDRRLDDLAGRLGHQAAHAAELADLVDVAAGAGDGHHGDGVEVAQRARASWRRPACPRRRGSPSARPAIRSSVTCLRAWPQTSMSWAYRSCSVIAPMR